MHEPIRLAFVTAIFALTGILSGCQKTQQYHFTMSGHHMLNNGQPFFWLGDTAWLLVKRTGCVAIVAIYLCFVADISRNLDNSPLAARVQQLFA